MSNENETKTQAEIDAESMTSEFRADNFAPKPFVKPVIKTEGLNVEGLTPQQVIDISKVVEQTTRETIAASQYDGALPGQVLRKSQAPITDFSKLTMDAVYDLSIPIEAKAFMSADVLAIQLKDTNYEPRWVNKNPQRLGDMIGKGFTYIEPNDLVNGEGIKTGLDAEGHYCFNDVVAMKIDKATYYAALRAAHERAISTTNESEYIKRAANTANGFMSKSEYSGDYANARAAGKMKFYDPNITI